MVRLLVCSWAALALAGCVDTKQCHMAVDWKPCPGQAAQAGASGSPPSIVELSLPTCAFVDAPQVTGSLRVTDPDGDAQVVKATLYVGMRNSEDELVLDDAGRNGNDWSGDLSVALQGSGGGMVMEGSDDVVMKVTDRAGAQSVPFCNTIALVR
ncbi:MAG TPA: hypothetical protein VF334_09000 [Polyangia bacterium]